MGIPDHLTCLLRNLYASQETAVRTGHGTMDWFKIGKGVCQGSILSPCLLNLYALECEVKWALESITTNKASGGDGIPMELFQILKDDAVKVLHSVYQQIWKTQQWPQDWKVSFHSNPKERQCQRMFKLPYNCTHFSC